jgi:hypothetical protein
MQSKGISIRNYEISTEWVDADEDIALFFRIPEGKKVLKMSV